MVNKVRLTIAGSPYVISTTDSEEYVTNLAQKLDADIASVMEENPNLSVTRAAVFFGMVMSGKLTEWTMLPFSM